MTMIPSLCADKDSRSNILRHCNDIITWIVVANRKTIRIFEDNDGTINLIDSVIYATSPSNAVTSRATGVSFRFKPLPDGKILTDERQHEHISFEHKASLKLDEALWNNRFDQIILLSEFDLIGNLFGVLSHPVQARTVAYMNNDIVYMESHLLKQNLQKIISNTINSLRGNRYEKQKS